MQGAVLPRATSQSAGDVDRCLRHVKIGTASSGRDCERSGLVVVRGEEEEDLVSCWSAMGAAHSHWSRARWSVGGDSDSCSC
jgi:hypothetical protein